MINFNNINRTKRRIIGFSVASQLLPLLCILLIKEGSIFNRYLAGIIAEAIVVGAIITIYVSIRFFMWCFLD